MDSENLPTRRLVEHDKNTEYKNLTRNSLFSIYSVYSVFFLNIIISFLLARLISQELWGFLILATSYVGIITLILSFLPPGLAPSLNFFLPRLIAKNEIDNLKAYIKYAIFIKLIFIIPIYIISLSIFISLSDIFEISLKNQTNLLLILSPNIIILGLNPILDNIIKGLNMFKTTFILLIIRDIVRISSLFVLFLFPGLLLIDFIAIINVISLLIPVVFNFLIIWVKLPKLSHKSTSTVKFKGFLKKTMRYGSYVKTGQFFSEIWGEIQNISVGTISGEFLLTGFNISKYYSSVSTNFPTVFSTPLTISFSTLNVQKKKDQMISLYNIFLIFLLLILLLIAGIQFFLTDFVLDIVFGESYLIYSNLLKVMLFSTIFLFVGTPFESFLLATNKVKWIFYYRFLAFIIRLPLFVVFLVNFGLIWGMISIIISNLLVAMIALFLSTKIWKLNKNLTKLVMVFFLFPLALGLTISFEFLVLDQINQYLIGFFNLYFFKNLNIFSVLFFILCYLSFLILFKIIKKSDIVLIETILIKDEKDHLILRKILDFVKFFLK